MSRYTMLLKLVTGMVVALLVWSAVAPITAFAIANPDSATTIGTVTVYQNVAETGDLGVLLDFTTYYATLPTETVTQAFMVSFNDVDGTTHLKTVVPYALIDKGYHQNLAWIYFTAAEVLNPCGGCGPGGAIVSSDMALYRVEVYGNPALGWVPGPAPDTFDTIDVWHASGDAHTQLAASIVTVPASGYAESFSTTWSIPLAVLYASVGYKLSEYGETYFTNVIANARTIAPAAFYTNTTGVYSQDLNRATSFGATMTNGAYPTGGVVTGSPIDLVEGANTVVVTTTGTFTLELNKGTSGRAESVAGGATVTGSPATLVAGTNTITITAGGTNQATITVNLQNTDTIAAANVSGTGFDTSSAATLFGLSRGFFSGSLWVALGLFAVSKLQEKVGSKTNLLLFDIWIICGAALGLVPVIAAALMFIGLGIFTGYVLLFRGAVA